MSSDSLLRYPFWPLFRNHQLGTTREKLIKIGAKIVRHARRVVFQLAEVAVPRRLFLAILCAIDRLRLPMPAPG
jgi:hypothetical protein